MDEVAEALEKYQGLVPLVYDVETMGLAEARPQDMQYAVYLKREADKFITDLEESHKMEVEQLLMEIVKLKADYKEACDRLQTANLIKDEQKAKADKLLSCLKYLVMRDLIKDCPSKKVATEIVKEYDNGLG